MANSLNTEFTLLYLFLLFSPIVAYLYNPVYNYAINCGNSANTTALDNRMWVGDNIDNSNIFFFSEPKSSNPSLTSQPISLSNVPTPFLTARVSFSNFTYSFSSINSSPLFIRFHFYPTSYQNFEPFNALFSVKVNNNLTLLKNFNPSLWLRNDDEEKITKEYCIQIKPNEKLDITFIPNNINQTNPYYAFVNAIEVVSMPSFLYYTDLNDTNYHLKLLGFDNSASEYQIRHDKALETVYRVNVGGNQVAPNDDTGMFRNWDNDFPLYLEKQLPQSVQADWADHLNFKNNTIPNYTAPEAVYFSARSYGMEVTEDYNVTWNFEVDSAFTYMVRLHFCEFDYHIKNFGDRAFQIFINDVMAEKYADVIYWSGAPMVPVHKDYAVTMFPPEGSSPNERVNLSIKLQRAPKYIYTKYHDVLLNGIEIFKINDKSNNLAGLNPSYSSVKRKALPTLQPKSKNSSILMVIVVGVSCVLLAAGIILLVFESNFKMEESSWKAKKEGSSTLPSCINY